MASRANIILGVNNQVIIKCKSINNADDLKDRDRVVSILPPLEGMCKNYCAIIIYRSAARFPLSAAKTSTFLAQQRECVLKI